jgi:hypothetical protein
LRALREEDLEPFAPSKGSIIDVEVYSSSIFFLVITPEVARSALKSQDASFDSLRDVCKNSERKCEKIFHNPKKSAKVDIFPMRTVKRPKLDKKPE